MPEQNANGSVPLDVVRQVVREEIAPLARDVTQLRGEFTATPRGVHRAARGRARGHRTTARGVHGAARGVHGAARGVHGAVNQIRGDVTELRGNYTQLREDVAQLAEGQKVLLEDMAEVKQAVRGHEARLTTLERGQV